MNETNNDVVLPGDKIGILEEFIPGKNTFEKNGKIFSSKIGKVVKDLDKKEISILSSTKKLSYIEKGDIVIGRVERLKKQMAMVQLIKIEGEKEVLTDKILAVLHISQIKDSYVADFSGIISEGDVIRAKVLNATSSQYQLGIMGKDFGVIKSFCKKCRKALVQKDKKLECPICGFYQYRKITPEYGRGVM